MSALGSSVINKSAKKFAPKVPTRRPAAPSSTNNSARASVDRQLHSHTPQPHDTRYHVTVSPAPSISHPTPASTQQHDKNAPSPNSHQSTPASILLPTSRDHLPTSSSKPASSTPPQIIPLKRTFQSQSSETTQLSAEDARRIEPPVDMQHRSREATNRPNVTVPSAEDSLEPPATQLNNASFPAPANQLSEPSTASSGAEHSHSEQPIAKHQRLDESPQSRTTDIILTANVNAPSSAPITNSNEVNEPLPTTEAEEAVGQGVGAAAVDAIPPKQPARTNQHSTTTNAKSKRRTNAAAAASDTGAVQASSDQVKKDGQPIKQKRQQKKSSKAKGKQRVEDVAAEIVADATGKPSGREKTGRRKRIATPENAETVVIAPSVVTMADLCRDSHTGRKSTRERELVEIDRTENIRKKQKKQQAKAVEGRSSQNPVDNILERAKLAPSSTGREGVLEPESESQTGREADSEQRTAQVVPNTVIVNGRIQIDESSLQIDRHANAEAERNAEHIEEVEENEFTRRVNSGSWMKREKRGAWNEEATDLFYDGLRMFGTDFEMIAKMFPNKTRRQIKLKFCNEEREDKQKIKETLLGERIAVDMAEFSIISNTVFKDPKELERELAEDRRVLEAEQALEKQAMDDALRQRAEEAAAEAAAVEDGTAAGGDSSAKENQMGSLAAKGSRGTAVDEKARGKAKSLQRKKAEKMRRKNAAGGGEVEVLGTIAEVALQERAGASVPS